MMKYRNFILVIISVVILRVDGLFAQQKISLEQCYEWAEANYPLLKQKSLNQQFTQVQLDNIDASKLPVLNWNAQASIQPEALKFALPLPGVEAIELPIYRLQTTIEAGYLLWDGGLLSARKNIEKASLATKQQALTVELYQIKDKIDLYFWGLAMLDVQDSILMNAEETVNAKLMRLRAAEEHGVMLPSTIKKLQVQKIKIEGEREATLGNKKSLIALLAAFTGQSIEENTAFVLPLFDFDIFTKKINRPELALFDFQKQQVLSNTALLDAKKKPKLSAFLQAGLGYPNPLNFFDTDISPYAIGGLKFSWNFIDWGQSDNQKQMLNLQSQIIDNRKETFEFNLSALEGKYREDIIALEKQIKKDESIVELQNEILTAFSSQLDHGIITASDYTTQLNDRTQAQLQLEIRRLQILKLKTEYLTKIGR